MSSQPQRNRRVPRVPLMVGIALPLTLLISSCASAEGSTASSRASTVCQQNPVHTPTPNPWSTMTDTELSEQLETFAADHAWQSEPGQIISEVATAFPNDYATGRLLDSTFEISFARDAPPDALAIMQRSTVPFDVHENVGFTEQDLIGVTSKISEVLEPLDLSGGGSWGADPYGQTFDVTIGFDDENGTGLRDCLAAHTEQLENALSEIESFGFPIVVTSMWGEPVASHG